MPEPAQFLAAFGLVTGNDFNGWTLTSASATHRAVTQYREYAYDITLKFEPRLDPTKRSTLDQLILALGFLARKQPTAWGVRNPYRCVIEPPVASAATPLANGYQIKLKGHSYRI